ncbi:hypothetical protein DEJ13_18065 (plasmid) [Curtobacterium sp. MCLR17_007]|uniref:phosphotriesterase family protein n=1 Tax=Curtobacterium sp. MCLR17_007 TaxID=2175648 RepID=UPI000DAA5F0F|nr:hypothetical protein [Curtobacterium sp. MCLR17_007]WIB62095.1 hypothetical protein DEJ13_18065 [Curtobacterium sp. MCLR17_007]
MTTTPEVMTVTGPIPADQLGVVLPHEHVFVDVMREYRGNGILHDSPLAIEELRDFAALGGSTLVDLTTLEIGRDPQRLAEVSKASGVQIVMGTGHYRPPYYDEDLFARSTPQDLADRMIDEVNNGVAGTGIRPGIIGEIGSNTGASISPTEEKSFRAAALTSLATGLSISTHAAWFPAGLPQLDILEDEGVEAHRIIIGHSDGVPGPDYQLELASRGVYVELDGFGTDSPYDCERALGYLLTLREHGHLDQILISHDVCLRTHPRRRGGPGYTWIARELVPRMADVGMSHEEIHQILVDNPRRALTGERPQ